MLRHEYYQRWRKRAGEKKKKKKKKKNCLKTRIGLWTGVQRGETEPK